MAKNLNENKEINYFTLIITFEFKVKKDFIGKEAFDYISLFISVDTAYFICDSHISCRYKLPIS